MKVAVSGKGGAGKTTIAAGLILAAAPHLERILAIDADPDPCLAAALGFSGAESIVPISEMKELISDRTGAVSGSPYFRINPAVADIPGRYCSRLANIHLLVIGTVKSAAGGCLCPESAFLKQLVMHLLLQRSEMLVMDMTAGIEHLGRATASGVDLMLVVVEPCRRSIQIGRRVLSMSQDLGIASCAVVGNKVRSPDEERQILDEFGSDRLIGMVPFSERVIKSARSGAPVPITAEILAISSRVEQMTA